MAERSPIVPGGLFAHELADLFQMIAPGDRAAFRADIEANGIVDTIMMLDGKVLDGRNRYREGHDLGFFAPDFDWRSDWRFVDFAVAHPDADPLAWVISKNAARRHETPSQRAMTAAAIEAYRHGGVRRPVGQDANLQLDRQAAADLMHVSERSVASAAVVLNQGDADLVDAVRQGMVAVSAAEYMAKLPRDEQRALIENADDSVVSAVIKARRAVKQDAKKVKRAAREAELGDKTRALPDRLYAVILGDPEWRFKVYSEATGMDRSADNHYPTSELDVIFARPIAEIAAPNCICFLWVTVPFLDKGIDYLKAQGFAYRSNFNWHKDKIGTGFWSRNRHEHLLIGVKGNVPAPAMGDQFDSSIEAAVARHSQKPEIFYEIIEAYFPTLPKIELNARTVRAGWDNWGLEAPRAEPEAVTPAGPTPEELMENLRRAKGKPQKPTLTAEERQAFELAAIMETVKDIPAKFDELDRAYGLVQYEFNEAMISGQAERARTNLALMHAILLKANGGKLMGLSVNKAPCAIRRNNRHNPGMSLLWGSEAVIEIECDGIRALVDIGPLDVTGKISLCFYAMTDGGEFPSSTGFTHRTGMVSIEDGRTDFLQEFVEDIFAGLLTRQNLVVPGTIYRLGRVGPVPVTRAETA